ncbi:MAG: AMP-binding protein [Draconibacterium sp.]|nr:AMP-binding protein [Draconibacterium sp.]
MKKIWIKSYDSEVPEKIDYNQNLFYDLLKIKASENPSEINFICLGKEISRISFLSITDRIAESLKSMGLQKGDRVAVMIPNLIQFPAFYFACLKMGFIFVPLNPLLAPPEISTILKISKSRVFIFLDLFMDKINKLDKNLAIDTFIQTSVKDFAPMGIKIIYPLSKILKKRVKYKYSAKRILFKKFYLKKISTNNSTQPIDKNDIAILLSTGGTTGVPKLAALSHENIIANSDQIASWVPNFKKGNAILGALPLFHSFGLTLCLNAALLTDGKVVLVPKFKTKAVIKLINKYNIVFMPGVPIMFAAFSKYISKSQSLKSIDSLKICISGGTELIPEIQNKFESLTKIKITEAYGLTESSPAVTSNPVNGIHKRGSIGIPLPSTLVQILDVDTFAVLQAGEIGEIAVKGPQIMQEYWGNKEDTDKVFRNGWLLTGDLGKMDKDGYIFLTGRKKEMIIYSGFKIYPQEVEIVLNNHPEIEEVGVCGIPFEYRGEAVKAVIVLKNNSTLTVTEIINYCEGRLASYKIPKEIEFTNALPKSFLGKVVRRLLD